MSRLPSDLPIKTLYAFLDCSLHATCPAHLIRLDLIFLVKLGEEYIASALCNFLHSQVTLSLLAPNIFLTTLFSSTLSLYSYLKMFQNRTIKNIMNSL